MTRKSGPKAAPADVLAKAAAADGSTDDRRAVLVELVDRVLGEHAEKPTVSVEELARMLGVGRSAAYEAIRTGSLPSIRFGRRVVVPVPAIAALLLGAENRPEVPS